MSPDYRLIEDLVSDTERTLPVPESHVVGSGTEIQVGAIDALARSFEWILEKMPDLGSGEGISSFTQDQLTTLGKGLQVREPICLRSASECIQKLENQVIREQATELVRSLSRALATVDTNSLPPLHVFTEDDGSLFLEWMLPGKRIGVTIEENPDDSCWFIVSMAPEEVNAYGSLRSDYSTAIRDALARQELCVG